MHPLSSTARGHLAAFFTIFVWGVTFISIKVLLGPFSPVDILFYRMALAAAALLIASPPRFTGGWTLRGEWKFALAGLCGPLLYMLFQNLALTYTLAANVSVLVSVAPLFTALISRSVLGERLKPWFFLGFAIAMAGIALIAFNGSLVLKLNPLGDLLSVLAALAWGFYSVLVKQISPGDHPVDRPETRRGADTLAVTRKVFTYGLVFMLPILPLSDFRLGPERLAYVPYLLNLLFLGVVASALCYATWNMAVRLLGPVKTSVYIYVIPVITIAASALVLHEPVTPVAAGGMALILAGMAISERG